MPRPEITRCPGDPENRGPRFLFPSFGQVDAASRHTDYYIELMEKKKEVGERQDMRLAVGGKKRGRPKK